MPRFFPSRTFFKKTLHLDLTTLSEHVILIIHTQTEFGERNE